MIEIKFTFHNFADMIEQLTGMCPACDGDNAKECAKQEQVQDAPVAEEPVVVKEEAPAEKPKRTRRKKKEAEPVAEEVVEKESADPEYEDVAASEASTITSTDVRAVLVKTRDRVGVDKLREMMAGLGYQSFADVPESEYATVFEKANALV